MESEKTVLSTSSSPRQAKSGPDSMRHHYERLIALLGENPKREGLKDTPERAAQALKDLTVGYTQDPGKIVGRALFSAENQELVLLRNIPFYSLCEHHLLPFFGRAHVAYYPDQHIIGLSKIPRLLDCFAKRLQVQETLTEQFAQSLNKILKPKGLAVILEANHLCMEMRGVEKTGDTTITSCYTGTFEKNQSQRLELLSTLAI